ncbi:MAG: poly(R)-hydroxyalkanoic acid synthase subunit PhaE [Pseudomonadota bacterium]
MPAEQSAGTDFLRQWLEAHRALFSGGAAPPLWGRAEALYKAWSEGVEAMLGAHAERHHGPGASPFDPAGWMRSEGAGGMADLLRWLEGPAYADLFAEQRRAIRSTREWLAWLAAAEQMKAVLAQGWLAAFGRFAERIGAVPPSEPLGWSAIVGLWQEIAGEEMTALYRTPAYLAAQRDLVAAETALRRALREQVEAVTALFGLPTRAELDDVHRSLHAFRREMRGLRAASGPAPLRTGGPRRTGRPR